MSSSRSAAQRPTARQAEYLAFIRAFMDRYRISPSFDEIGRHFMTTTPSVNNMIKTLEARGFLRRIPGQARTLQVVVPNEQLAPVARPRGGTAVHDAEIRVAVHMAVATVERLVPALDGVDHDKVYAALIAVRMALEMACGDASDDERKQARAAFARAVALARKGDRDPERGT